MVGKTMVDARYTGGLMMPCCRSGSRPAWASRVSTSMGSPPRAYCTARRRRLRTGAARSRNSDTLLAVSHWERLRTFMRDGLWALDLDRRSPRARLGVRLLRFVVVLAWDY